MTPPRRALPPPNNVGLRRRRLDTCRRMIAQRSQIGRHIGFDLCADPILDILLDLYVARSRGQKIAITSLCIAANVPTTTALRCVAELVSRAMVQRSRDPRDARRIFVQLTDRAKTMLDKCFDGVCALG